MFAIPFYWHYVLGSWAFGTVFMATDPSSAFTHKGKLIYDFYRRAGGSSPRRQSGLS